MKVVINNCFGGFGLSTLATQRLKESGFKGGVYEYGGLEKHRSDPLLIQVVEQLGDEANGEFAELKIIEIPDGTDYVIEEYDGNEHVSERHRIWG